MQFTFDEDQRLAAQSLRDLLDDLCTGADLRRAAEARDASSFAAACATRRERLRELGFDAALVPEAQGGLGLRPVDLVLLAEEAGRAALPESLIETAGVSLPLLSPYLVLVALFRVADSLKQFDLVWPVSRGGPLDSTRLLHVQGYEEAFRFSSPAMAMAIIFVLWIIIYLASFLLLRLWRRTINVVE